MKKTLIISSVVIVTLLLLIFVYILFFGTPKSVQDVFTNFNIGGGAGPVITDTPGTVTDTLTETEGFLSFGDGPFFKLTTRPVAGMGFVGTTTLRYAELGTGHIYEIDLEEQSESLVSSRTFQKVRSATFSTEGSSVIFEIEKENVMESLVGSLVKSDTGENTLNAIFLPEGSHDAGFTEEGTVLYLQTVSTGTEIHEYDQAEAVDTLVLSLPHQRLRAAWPSHVYTTPTAQLSGYVYDISAGSIDYVREGGMGLTAYPFDSGVIVTTPEDTVDLASYAIQEGVSYVLPQTVVPEKCTDTHQATTTILCAIDTDTLHEITYPDDWYKGKESFSDTFWTLPISGQGGLDLFPASDYVRDFDVLKIVGDATGNFYLFIDKNDNSLWLFGLPLRVTF
jgi:hypothetical protein